MAALVRRRSLAILTALCLGLASIAVASVAAQTSPQTVTRREVRLPSGRAHAVISSLTQPARLFCGTEQGLFTTNDGGQTWAPLGINSANEEVFAVAAHPTNPSIMLAGRRDGLWKTQDAGTTWKRLPYPEMSPVLTLAVAFAPSQPRVVYMTTGRHGIYRSADGGSRWEQLDNGLPRTHHGQVDEFRGIVVDPRDHRKVYVAHELHGIYRTVDGGKNWHQFGPLPSSLYQLSYPPLLVFDPRTPDLLLAVLGVRIHSHLIETRVFTTSPTGQWIPLEVELPANVRVSSVTVNDQKRMLEFWSEGALFEVPATVLIRPGN